MATVLLDMSMSLDGFIARPNDDDAGLHDYFFAPSKATAQVIEEGLHNTGAIILGRRTYNVGAEQDGFADSPYKVPHFVLSHDVPEKIANGPEFIFVTSGIESALDQARAAAGDRDVVVGGGADVTQQFLKAGLVDEIQLYLVSILLGNGIRLFEQLEAEPVALETTRVIDAPDVTILRFRVLKGN